MSQSQGFILERKHMGSLRGAAARRLLAVQELEESLAAMNSEVRAARAAGIPVALIAKAIGTTRQRVYEILREG